MAAEDFVPTLCDIALKGGSKDVQRVAAGVLSTTVVRPTCRDIVFTGSSLQDVLRVVLDSKMPEVYTQVLWAISYFPLGDEFVLPLLENHVIERMKQMLTEDHVGVQTQARATIVQLSANKQLRNRFIELGFLPLLVARTSTHDLSCCEASILAMQTLSDSPILSASLLDFGVELKLQEILHECLQHESKLLSISSAAGSRTSLKDETESGPFCATPLSAPSDDIRHCSSPHTVQEIPRELEAARSAALGLLCQLSNHAVQEQLAMLDDATVTMVINCIAGARIRAIEEKRSAALLLRLWAGVERTRKLLLSHGVIAVLLQLILSTEEPTVMHQLAWSIGNIALGESSTQVETQLAEAGAVDALLYYTTSMHEEVRRRAQWALGMLDEETLKYNAILASRSSEALGLPELLRRQRELLRRRWQCKNDRAAQASSDSAPKLQTQQVLPAAPCSRMNHLAGAEPEGAADDVCRVDVDFARSEAGALENDGRLISHTGLRVRAKSDSIENLQGSVRHCSVCCSREAL
ncbi:Armadillo/beta-catenin family repeat-containing protein [Besnoitia besnoiti]|uniref:Armadillo/beta-catenin family repeat-containing protein n=1 Tax=Besnoitia besnoiti TaxID=94643 RepID=A0A2A9M2G6_BESBE|nr:Armadillo/beta-catenin family repeat-containing protein [Besnoitia besnoiti]PFH32149.1 Armadillo/beta-catenin family repeat-containing protein [Besnoitia besnoiti]